MPPETIDRLWLRGGFPESFLAPDGPASFEWRNAFLRTYLERDIPQLGPAEDLGVGGGRKAFGSRV